MEIKDLSLSVRDAQYFYELIIKDKYSSSYPNQYKEDLSQKLLDFITGVRKEKIKIRRSVVYDTFERKSKAPKHIWIRSPRLKFGKERTEQKDI